jgi:hypothetical protein
VSQQAALPDFLTRQTTPALRAAHAKAMAASALHQAAGRFYFASLCEERAKDILAVLDQRAAQAEAA